MGKAEQFELTAHHPLEAVELVNDIAQRYSCLVAQQLRNGLNGDLLRDDLGLTEAFSRAKLKLFCNPHRMAEQQQRFWFDATRLWQHTLLHLLGYAHNPVIAPAQGDFRFQDEAWQDNPLFDFIKQVYLLTARSLYETLVAIDGLDDQIARKVEFFTRQFIDACAPTNFMATNPEAQREFIRTGGLSLLRGLRNWLRDLEHGNGMLKIRMTDERAFELGKNVAVTPGQVVFQNALLQLIQYQPATATVKQRPLLIVPPWINKYYILDLRPQNSFIKWAVEQGHTVFVISWVNPDASYADTVFEDYLREGALAALDAVVQASGSQEINAIGYCLGGTLLACTLAYLAASGDERVKSATFFASLMDFACPGELGVFIDEGQLAALERRMARGFLDGSEMATTFNMLRANDLIWSFFINNYLLGKDPFPFDLLYWNSDSTRMPAAMHRFYLRSMYEHNLLCEPGGITLLDTPIDLGKIKVPAYFLSTIEDHIAPWRSTYAGTQLLKGDKRFVLGGSGHIAGVINPPRSDRLKYGYWTNANGALPADPNEWLRAAERHEGSWWPDWERWISSLDDEQVPARIPGDGKLAVIEDAPGSYVRQRIA
jgi:polyhydroxyalkanoate synthase